MVSLKAVISFLPGIWAISGVIPTGSEFQVSARLVGLRNARDRRLLFLAQGLQDSRSFMAMLFSLLDRFADEVPIDHRQLCTPLSEYFRELSGRLYVPFDVFLRLAGSAQGGASVEELRSIVRSDFPVEGGDFFLHMFLYDSVPSTIQLEEVFKCVEGTSLVGPTQHVLRLLVGQEMMRISTWFSDHWLAAVPPGDSVPP